jgi:D-alanyl-lipoteichoic acid acyltransferase DltB (MBOAT superfamily)
MIGFSGVVPLGFKVHLHADNQLAGPISHALHFVGSSQHRQLPSELMTHAVHGFWLESQLLAKMELL